ncbi:hypothetical protein DFJ74DRAFT_697428 [Hyaloraphidium curvatum]|nr:hypothetical protein DFJ74DRAFT_698050 [Hyaloraphidium curvatum]KAI9001870.1 hypothetical protein DFJ74DRAFT_697428 [Hyaloraphidium curvatum]
MAVPAEGARAASPAQPRHHRAAGPAALPAELLPVFVTRAEAFKMSHTLSTRLRFAGFKVARGLEGKTFREVADIFDAPPSPRREALPHSPRRDALPDREPPGGAKRGGWPCPRDLPTAHSPRCTSHKKQPDSSPGVAQPRGRDRGRRAADGAELHARLVLARAAP